MEGAERRFIINWNSHTNALFTMLKTLLESGTLADCTLAAEGKSLKAHKMVLCACSTYFEELLSQHYEKHPIIILKDIKFQDLKKLMEYMYKGEVDIFQNDLKSLLNAAELLKIKGLSVDDDKTNLELNRAPVGEPVQQQSVTIGSSTTAQGLTTDVRPESPHFTHHDASPTPRKRKRNLRRRIQHMPSTSSNSDSHIDMSNCFDGTCVPNIPATITKGSPPLEDGDQDTDNSHVFNNHDTPAAVKI